MASKKSINTLRYTAVIAGCFVLGLAVSWLPLAKRIDNLAYDWMSSRAKLDWQTHSVVVGVDERTFEARHGVPNLRPILSGALDSINAAKPAGVAIDVLLHDEVDPDKDARLEAALRATPNLVLPCELVRGAWEDPLPRFLTSIPDELGQVQLEGEPGRRGDSRFLSTWPPEATAAGPYHYRALALMRDQPIIYSVDDVQVGNSVIPAPRRAAAACCTSVTCRTEGFPSFPSWISIKTAPRFKASSFSWELPPIPPRKTASPTPMERLWAEW